MNYEEQIGQLALMDRKLDAILAQVAANKARVALYEHVRGAADAIYGFLVRDEPVPPSMIEVLGDSLRALEAS